MVAKKGETRREEMTSVEEESLGLGSPNKICRRKEELAKKPEESMTARSSSIKKNIAVSQK